jgi:hypothetical protein
MQNILNENVDIKLDKGKYIVLDGLYVNLIKEFMNTSLHPLSINRIKDEVFPYSDIPFGIYEFKSNVEIGLKDIKRTRFENITNASDHYISIDSGIMVFISFDIFFKFIELFDYNELVKKEPINEGFWNIITESINSNKVGLVLSPGINFNFEFEGSGIYYLDVE